MTGDLYAALRAPSNASADQLRQEFDRIRRSYPPTAAEYLAAAQAYAILGDPRRRAEYDAGHVVGLGVASYFQRAAGPESPGAAPVERPLQSAASVGPTSAVGQLEARWRRRRSSRYQPAATGRPAGPLIRWPFVFFLGNISGGVLTIIAIRLALGHPINQ